ncbi:DNA restriction-modification system, specificity subunit [Corynebacterium jeikeium]|jgi:type I restriction enzyme, S subunit|uniref:Putative DNA restriction-modification system, specificity subunit n=1 Tax=Corynebacterium jeikeium (strain K411) TaxID=306537 RepID=Q4JUT7_CORJK|nr:restriction endonuclease subunit S [Corynebacterium jeikeium]CAI37420.1 putative DNA restriction-modification system, specificity subunit [Corynebacterium jeikeium K411]SUY85236.1 DNA restriction-modification system, specificity subunit [Corynebacterium jeikeium]
MTGDWIDTTIGELAVVTRGASPRPISSDRWFDDAGKVGWIRIADVNRSNGRELKVTSQRLSEDGILRSRFLDSGTLILSIAASVGIPVITQIPACIHDGFVALTSVNADQKFMLYLLKAAEGRLREAGQSGSQMNINSDIVRGLPVKIPADFAEQKAISSALWEKDDLISSLERLISKKQAIKQGMMQELLTGRTRLPGFSASWFSSTWGELALGISSGATPRRGVAEYWNGEIPWVTSTELKRGPVDSIPQSITTAGLRAANLRIWPAGTFLMAITGLEAAGTRGKCGLLSVAAATNQSCMAVAPGPDLDTEFLFYYYLHYGNDLAFKYVQGTKQQSYTAAIVKKLPIHLPSDVSEQQAIAQVLRDADHEIAALERCLESARNIKQGMMQELLTGRTRLPFEGESA